MTNNNFNKFNAKKFNLYNKDLQNKDVICKMLVNYKWSVAHLEAIDKKYADNARAQFDAMIEQFNVQLEAPKTTKAEKKSK
ncbi:MAG: hypothetical protein NC218_03235 [Acetobacter sp.]|nr:hypothetical protein [Acetobacter sp.]